MAITITRTIGTAVGRDYSTLAGWQAGEQGDLVALGEIHRGECYPDSAFTAGVSISGSITDSLNYMSLGVAPANKHNGTPGSGVVIALNALNVIDVIDPFTVVEDIEIDGGGVGISSDVSGINMAGASITCRGNIIHGLTSTFFTQNVLGIQGLSSGCQVYNNLIYDLKCEHTIRGAKTRGVILDFNTEVYHNTIHNVFDVAPNEGSAIEAGMADMNNNIFMDSGSSDHKYVTFSGTSTNNMDSDGSLAGTSNQLNKIATNQFTNIATSDFTLKSGAGAIGNGVPVTLVTTDIAGNFRDAVTPDIGCFEFQGGALPALTPILRRRREY